LAFAGAEAVAVESATAATTNRVPNVSAPTVVAMASAADKLGRDEQSNWADDELLGGDAETLNEAEDQAAFDARGTPLEPLRPDPSNQHPSFRPGPFAGGSVRASSTGKAKPSEQTKLNELFEQHGCHTCGTKKAGTPSGNPIGDHQPVTALNKDGLEQDLYPHCQECSDDQGLAVLRYLRNLWRNSRRSK
jgi:hypothetical protein